MTNTININTIQDNINQDNINRYIESVINLGQRLGAKGDSISISDFTINDIYDKEITDAQYIKYDISNEGIITMYKVISNEDRVELTYKTNNSTSFNSISPIETILNTHITCSNISIVNDNNNYTFKSIVTSENTTGIFSSYIYVLEFNGLNINDYNSLIITTENNSVYIYNGNNSNNTLISISTDASLTGIYNTYVLNDGNSIDEILSALKNNSSFTTITNTDEYANLNEQLRNCLPQYIIDTYNTKVLYFDNTIVGEKTEIFKSIINNIIKNHGNYGKSDFSIYFNPNLIIKFFKNDSTNQFYSSLGITCEYIENFSQDLLSDGAHIIVSDISNVKKAIVFSTVVEQNQLGNINIDTSVSQILPFINGNVWNINGEDTNISAIGKDAGNPNIVLLNARITGNVPADGSWPTSTIGVLHSFDNVQLNKVFEDTFKDANNTTEVTFNFKLLNNAIDTGNNDNSSDVVYSFKFKLPSIGYLSSKLNTDFDNLLGNSLIFISVDTKLSVIGSNSDINYSPNTTLSYLFNNNTDAETSFITVLYAITKDDKGGYEWKLITNPIDENSAFDFSTMIANYQLAKYYATVGNSPDDYEFNYLIFKGVEINTKTDGNAESLTSKIVHPILFNIYDTEKTTSSDGNDQTIELTNRLNLTPAFIPIKTGDVTEDGKLNIDNIDFSSQESKLMEFNGDNVKFSQASVSTSANGVDFWPYSFYDGSSGAYANIPFLDLGEVIVKNETVLNRFSLLNIDSEGYLYNAYFGNSNTPGSPHDVLYLGTGKQNLSFTDNKTVIDPTVQFKEFKKLNINLPVENEKLTFTKVNGNLFTTVISIPLNDVCVTPTAANIQTDYLSNTTYYTYTVNYAQWLNNNGYSNIINTPTTTPETTTTSQEIIPNTASEMTATTTTTTTSPEIITNNNGELSIDIITRDNNRDNKLIIIELLLEYNTDTKKYNVLEANEINVLNNEQLYFETSDNSSNSLEATLDNSLKLAITSNNTTGYEFDYVEYTVKYCIENDNEFYTERGTLDINDIKTGQTSSASYIEVITDGQSTPASGPTSEEQSTPTYYLEPNIVLNLNKLKKLYSTMVNKPYYNVYITASGDQDIYSRTNSNNDSNSLQSIIEHTISLSNFDINADNPEPYNIDITVRLSDTGDGNTSTNSLETV